MEICQFKLLIFRENNGCELCLCFRFFRYFVVGPNAFRLNVEETVSVQVWQASKVEVFLQDSAKSKIISKVTKDLVASESCHLDAALIIIVLTSQ